MKAIDERADALFEEVEKISMELGSEAHKQYQIMVSAYKQILMIHFYKHINEMSPENRDFKITILPESEERRKETHFTGTLVELADLLTSQIYTVPFRFWSRIYSENELKYVVSLLISSLNEKKDEKEIIEYVQCNPVHLLVEMQPLNKI
ncbi:hypothetical protein [Shewanella phage FishSpeaker]|nr:hypothetical protein [Shewanella phage FishSpeaker]